MIYEYTLTEVGGLVADVVSPFYSGTRFRAADNTADKNCKSNQLRLVCRQLHAETNGLGLAYNDLTFKLRERKILVSVYDLFDRFTFNCAPRHLGNIRRVTILDDKTKPPEEDVQLASLLSPSVVRFCQRYPAATVIVRFQWLVDYENYTEDVDCMIYLSIALERPNLFLSEGGCLVKGLAEALDRYFQGVVCPNKLHFSCSHVFNERSTRLNIEALNDTDYQRWMEIARRVHKTGV